MARRSRLAVSIFSLAVLLAFGAQVLRGIITGTASQCQVSGTCR